MGFITICTAKVYFSESISMIKLAFLVSPSISSVWIELSRIVNSTASFWLRVGSIASTAAVRYFCRRFLLLPLMRLETSALFVLARWTGSWALSAFITNVIATMIRIQIKTIRIIIIRLRCFSSQETATLSLPEMP